jgi:hypothetical protein
MMKLDVARARARAAALLLLLVGTAAVGPCENPDVHDYSVEILNDDNVAVQVWQCDVSCDSGFHARVVLQPGAHTATNVSTVGVPNTWLVLDRRSHRIGCLPIVMPEPVSGLIARISRRTRCLQTYDESRQWPS